MAAHSGGMGMQGSRSRGVRGSRRSPAARGPVAPDPARRGAAAGKARARGPESGQRTLAAGPRDAASASVLAFMVAGVIFIASIGAVVLASGTAIQDNEDTATPIVGQAASLRDMLLGSPGHDAWLGDPDAVQRLGLLTEDRSGVDIDKLANLRRAGLEEKQDGLVNYPEAVRSLGLEGYDMHIRTEPSLQSVQELLKKGSQDRNLRITYIGDYEKVDRNGQPHDPAAGLTVTTPTCQVSPDSDQALRVAVLASHQAIDDTHFHMVFDLDFGGPDVTAQTGGGWEEPPELPFQLALDVPALGRTCADLQEMRTELYDIDTRLVESTFPGASIVDLGGTPQATDKDLWADTDRLWYNLSQDVGIEYSGDIKKNDPLRLTVKNALGLPVYGPVDFLADAAAGKRVHSFAASSIGVGDFTVHLQRTDTDLVVTERLLVLAQDVEAEPYEPPLNALDYEPQEPVAFEVEYLERIALLFCPYDHQDPTVSPLPAPEAWEARCPFKQDSPFPGDIVPDLKQTLNDALPQRLAHADGTPRYDITNAIFVGSNTDHNAMTSASAKYAVRDWVLGGGLLIVLGSEDQQVQWLQPLFHSGIQSSSTGIAVPDASHPILHVPNVLEHEIYDNNDRAWKVKETELFTQVIVDGAGNSIVTLSDPGAYGDGTVVLTTWTPHDLHGTGPGTSEQESLKLIHNLMVIGYRDLFLDYGPRVPIGQVEVVPAIGTAMVDHPAIGPVALRVRIYVFPA